MIAIISWGGVGEEPCGVELMDWGVEVIGPHLIIIIIIIISLASNYVTNKPWRWAGQGRKIRRKWFFLYISNRSSSKFWKGTEKAIGSIQTTLHNSCLENWSKTLNICNFLVFSGLKFRISSIDGLWYILLNFFRGCEQHKKVLSNIRSHELPLQYCVNRSNGWKINTFFVYWRLAGNPQFSLNIANFRHNNEIFQRFFNPFYSKTLLGGPLWAG